ncbi:MAG: type VI secretion system tip protein VgrG [Desulfobacterium sp.]|nr:type VI secretion system tip protein VgrG [Desulfobacterium sp.]
MYTQENRLFAVDTPLGLDVLLLTGFRGSECLSDLFAFELDLISQDHSISFIDIIGKNVSVSIMLADGSKRYINGIISSFRQGTGDETGSDSLASSYKATLVPWFWLLTRTADSRIFQKLSVPDIVEKIFTEYGFNDHSFRLQGSYEPRDYAVQYRETDFNFISRLLEEEGIYYFFEHEEKKHTLVLADAPTEHKPCPKQASARYRLTSSGLDDEDLITTMDVMKEIRVGKCTLNDFNFEVPNTDLKVTADSRDPLGPGEREVYDYPGRYTKHDAGDRLTNIRMEEEESRTTTITGDSTCRAFTGGFRFMLEDYFREDMNDKEFVLTHVEHNADQKASYRSGGAATDSSYANRFECMPFEVPFRPWRKTPKPVVKGVQTAIVVGPPGEEIYTDEFGRVKVQFHWDREGQKNEDSSCWIRVSQVCAGAGWGAIDTPRIGHEVIVDFLEGDPDKPIVTGRVYHGSNRPPTGLPAAAMVSGMKSNSTPGGGGYNEMTMNDTKGEEGMTIHAQKDMDTTVENDHALTVHNNRTTTVDVDDTETVTGNQTLTVDGTRTETVNSDETITINASRTEHVTGSEDVTIDGATSHTINANFTRSATANYALTAGANIKTDAGAEWEGLAGSKALLKAPEIKIEADTMIEIVCGGSSIKLEPAKITITSGSGSIEVHAPGVDIKGGKISLN